jgi:hypothetical protein
LSNFLGLELHHDKTKRQNDSVEDPRLFRPLKSLMNFDEDCIEFRLSAHYVKFREIQVTSKIAWFTLIPTNVRIPIISDEMSRDEGEQTIITVRASFKDQFLNLFSSEVKRFALSIIYKDNHGKNCISSYIAPIPVIDQTDWDPHSLPMTNYLPHSVGGFHLVKLFANKFRIDERSSIEEKKLYSMLM